MTRRALYAVAVAVLAYAWLWLYCAPLRAEVNNVSVAPYPECLNRSLVGDLVRAGARGWEIRAAVAIGSGRGPVSIAADGDCSFASLDPCPWPDPLIVLYSDAGPAEVLRVWRRRVAPAVAAAPWPHEVAAGLANSAGSGWVIRTGEACEWDLACVADQFATTPHRRRRLAALGVPT
jgi:hypothetical protein